MSNFEIVDKKHNDQHSIHEDVTANNNSNAKTTKKNSNKKVELPSNLSINPLLYLINQKFSSKEFKVSQQLLSYKNCIFINACLCEGPICVVEAFCRFVVFIVFAIVCAIIAPFFICFDYETTEYLISLCFSYIVESLLSIAAGISLVVPGIACFVYKNFNSLSITKEDKKQQESENLINSKNNDKEDESIDWTMAPIPTVFGWVDSRRFFSFTMGQGRTSKLVDNSFDTIQGGAPYIFSALCFGHFFKSYNKFEDNENIV